MNMTIILLTKGKKRRILINDNAKGILQNRKI